MGASPSRVKSATSIRSPHLPFAAKRSGAVESNCVVTSPARCVAHQNGRHRLGLEQQDAAAGDVAYTAAQGTCIGWNWLGSGGLTSALSIITDFGSYDDVVIRRCRIEGGSYAAYVPGQEGNGYTIRNVEFVDNRLSGGQSGDVTGSSPDASILHWHGNIHDPGRTGSGTTVQMPSIGGERA